MKIKLLSEKEYARICLECPKKRCIPYNCDRIKGYRVMRCNKKVREDDKSETKES